MDIEKAIATLTLSGKNPLNVMSTAVLLEFDEILERLSVDEKLKVVILRSASERAFTAGADIKEMEKKSKAEAKAYSELGHRIAGKLERNVPPVIAALNGYVLGGGVEIACACDIRIASEDALFSQPEINIGVIPGWGGTQRLFRIVGLAKAKELIYTGRRIDAYEALEVGLVNRVVPKESLDETVNEVAQNLSGKSRESLIAAKRAFVGGLSLPYDEGLKREIASWTELFEEPTQKEGMRAFLEHRKPDF